MPSRRQRRQTEPMYLATSVSLDAAPLGRAATVVGDGGDVPDGLDLDPRGLEGPDGRLPAAPRPFDADVEGAEAALLGGGGAGGGRLLGREGRPLAGALEAQGPRAGPGDHVAFEVGDGHVGVVEGGVYVGDAVHHVLLLLLRFFRADDLRHSWPPKPSSRGSWPAAAPCGCGRSCGCAGPARAGCAGGASPR